MKKFFLGVFAIAGLVACVQTEEVDIPNLADNQIAFGGYVGNSVRTAVDPSTTVGGLNHFTVWAYVGDSQGEVFNSTLVSKDGNNAWTYDDARYWMDGHDYRFFAITPYGKGVSHVEVVNNPMKAEHDPFNNGLGQINFTNENGTEDVLYASSNESTKISVPEKVTFNFNHLLSKIKFTFTNGFPSPYNTLEVTNICMQVPSKGSVDLTQTTRPYLWDVVTTNNDITLSFGNAINKLDATKGVSLGSSESGECEFECLTLPIQNGTTLVPHLNVTFDVVLYQGDQVAIAKSNRLAKLVLDGSLTGLEKGIEQGKAYRINATLNSENITDDKLLEIKFDDVKVDEWITAENPEVVYDAGAINTQPAQ